MSTIVVHNTTQMLVVDPDTQKISVIRSGPTGPGGPPGETGATGPAGPAGPVGEQGEIGPQGDTGATGPAGPAGPEGPEGPPGAEGPQGDPGPTGAQGPPGDDGADGSLTDGNYGHIVVSGGGEVMTIVGGVYGLVQPKTTLTGSHVLDEGDLGRLLTMNNASAMTLTLPSDASYDWPIGVYVDVMQYGAGQITLVAGSGAQIWIADGLAPTTRAQYSRAGAQKVTANTWSVFGDLEAA